jgi:hypothetical protein
MQQVKAELDEITASILAAEATIKRTQGLSQAEELLKSAEGRFGRRQQAETIITRWNKAIWDLEQAEKIIGKTQGIFTAGMLVDSARKDLAQIDSLFAIYRQFGTVKMGICKADSVLHETKAVLSVEPMITELYSFMDRKSKLAMLYGKWDQSKEDTAAIERQRQNAESDVNKYSDKYYETLKQAGKCPLCGANTNIDYGRVI